MCVYRAKSETGCEVMVLDSGDVFMEKAAGEGVGGWNVERNPPGGSSTPTSKDKTTKKEKVLANGLPGAASAPQAAQRRSTPLRCGGRPALRRPLSLEVTPQRQRGSADQREERKILQPPWRSGPVAPSPPMRSLTSPSLAGGSWMRRSESTCSVNYPLSLRAGRGRMRPASSLPHIAKGAEGVAPPPPRPCLLVALRPLNLEQEKLAFFQSDFSYEPQFEYAQPEPRGVLDKYREGAGLFLEQVLQRPPPCSSEPQCTR